MSKLIRLIEKLAGQRLLLELMITPLFPLSNVVLFPKTPIPIHIFEEHHQAMIRDAMAGDRELTFVLLRNEMESESEYAGFENMHEVACLGRIEACDEFEDGHYDIVVVGIRRVRIIRTTRHFPYLMAEVEALPEFDYDDYPDVLADRHGRISGLFSRFVRLATDGSCEAGEIIPKMDFESLVNTIAMTLNITTEQKQGLLEMDDAFQRCDILSAILQQQIETLGIIRRFEYLKPENPHFN